MTKIERVSRYFRILFQIMLIAALALEAIIWITAPVSLNFLHALGSNIIPIGYFPYLDGQAFSTTTKLYGFLVSMIPTGIHLFILYFLIKLFRLFEQSEIFTPLNVRYIRNIGYLLLIGQLLLPIYEALIGVVITWQNVPGHRLAMVSVGTNNIGMILVALLVILISWIMAEGCKLREEQQLTI